MKKLKLILDDQDDSEIYLGLLRLSKKMPDHEFFFHLNQANPFYFKRAEDFIFAGNYYEYKFPKFRAYSKERKTCIDFIANKNSEYIRKKIITELFTEETEKTVLLKQYDDVDYIIKTSEPFPDFSVILLPENTAFQIQQFSLSSEHELYSIFQYYE